MFCGIFRKARKHITVFQNDSQRPFNLSKNSQKIDLIQKCRVNSPNFKIKNQPFVDLFYPLTLLKLYLYMQVLLVSLFAVCANGYIIVISLEK